MVADWLASYGGELFNAAKDARVPSLRSGVSLVAHMVAILLGTTGLAPLALMLQVFVDVPTWLTGRPPPNQALS